jgi:hypothetical protein
MAEQRRLKVMENSEFKDRIETLYKFVRLHQWCTQTDSMIGQVISDVESSPGDSFPVISSLVKKKLCEDLSVEEKILSVVLLRKVGISSLETTSLLYDLLLGKIHDRDFSFISNTLFHGQRPLPLSLSYDILNRVFLSFRRAIYHAIKIDKFHSPVDPESMVLYLVSLLCRDDLNEQNRAIVYLLLSRIDTDLPSNVMKGVIEYIYALHDIIEDVESRQEAVLSDTFDIASEPHIKEDSHNQRRPDPSTQDASMEPESLDMEETDSSKKPKKRIWADKHLKDLPEDLHTEKTNRIEQAKRDYQLISQDRIENGEVDLSFSPPAAEQKGVEFDFSLPPGGYNTSEDAVGNSDRQISRETLQSKPFIKAEAGDSFDDRNYLARNTIMDNPSFVVRFSRTSREVLQILRKMNMADGVHQTTDKKSVKKRKSERMAKRKKEFAAILVVFVLVVAILAVIFLVPNKSNDSSEDLIVRAVESTLEPESFPPAIDPNHIIPESPPLVEEAAHADSTSYQFERTGNGIQWVPKSGDSLWKLFQYLTETDVGHPEEVTGLPFNGWHSFLARVLELNPGIEYPHLIYPEGRILIHRIEE